MSITLFAENLLESAASITVQPPADAGFPLARLYDRARRAQYESGTQDAFAMPVVIVHPLMLMTPTQTVIKIDLGSNRPLSAWAMLNTDIAATVTLKADTTNPPTTTRDSVNPAGADFLRTFVSASVRYIWVTIAAVNIAVGELMLGVQQTVSLNPFLEKAGYRTVGNVGRDRARAGDLWSVKRGVKRARLPWGWTALTAAQVTQIQTAFTDCGEASKKVLVLDELGILRWMDWLTEVLDPVPNQGLYALDIMLEESIQ